MKVNRFVRDLLSGRWVELMHAGKYNGIEMTPQVLQDMAANYDPDYRVAPLTIGHTNWLDLDPERESHGQVSDLRVVNNVLQAKFTNLSDTVIAGLKAGKWINRSIEAMKLDHSDHNVSRPDDPKKAAWYLTALALLGGSQPAVPAMFSSKDERLCIDCSESQTTDIDNPNQPPKPKEHHQMEDAELKRLEKLEADLKTQAGESKDLKASIEKLTGLVTQLSTDIGELKTLKADNEALKASTTALVDAQAQLAVNEATKGLPKDFCSDAKKERMKNLYKTDKAAFEDECRSLAATRKIREKTAMPGRELITEDGSEENSFSVPDGADAESATIDHKAQLLIKANPKLSYRDACSMAAEEV